MEIKCKGGTRYWGKVFSISIHDSDLPKCPLRRLKLENYKESKRADSFLRVWHLFDRKCGLSQGGPNPQLATVNLHGVCPAMNSP